MTPEEFERERLASAAALDHVIDGARGRDEVRSSEALLGPLETEGSLSQSEGGDPAPPPSWTPPTPPDPGPVNRSFGAEFEPSAGFLAAFVERRSEQSRAALVKFNADQVRFDNALLAWASEHLSNIHHQFGAMQTRMDEIDARHRELERELIRHVHEMARRIDVVLGEGEKSRVSHESALRSIRERLGDLEEKLR